MSNNYEERRDRFQLRVGHVNALSVLPRLPALFSGAFFHPDIGDYHCSAVSIHASEPTPFQIGGDEVGKRSLIHLGLAHVRAVSRASLLEQPISEPAADPRRAALSF